MGMTAQWHRLVTESFHWVKRTCQNRVGLLDQPVQFLPLPSGDTAAPAENTIKDY